MSLFNDLCAALAALLGHAYSVWPSYAGSISLVTVGAIAVLSPLTLAARRRQRAVSAQLAALAPELERIKRSHPDPVDRHNATVAAYARHGIHPAGALAPLVPVVLQAPVMIALFTVLRGLGRVRDGLADPRFLAETSALRDAIVADGGRLPSLGLDLAASPAHALSGGLAAAAPAVVLLVSLALVGLVGVRLAARRSSQPANPLANVFALASPLFALGLPAGLGVYFLVSAVARVAQQEALRMLT